jgi:hypothetical protein
MTEAEIFAAVADLNIRDQHLARKEQEVNAQLSLLQTDRARLDADRKELTARQLQHAERVAEFAVEREREQQHSEYSRAIKVKPPAPGGPVVFGSDVSRG